MDRLEITNETIFQTASHQEISLSEVIMRIQDYYKSDPHNEFRLSIGTDSMTYDETRYVLAIVVHKVGKGGIYFYKRLIHDRVKDLHDKLYRETQLSIDTAELLIENLLETDEALFEKMQISIHLDIGKNGPTKALIRELEGWVKSMGYDYAIKPDSYAASTIADLYSK